MSNPFDQAPVHPAIRDKISNFQADTVASAKRLVAAHDLVILGMAQNPFPGRARRLLDDKGIKYEYLSLGSYFSQWRPRLGLKLWARWPTFPMIFVKGTLIGGYQDLKLLLESGELQRMLQAS